MSERIQDRCRNRWRDILRAVGFSERQLSGHHGACPLCPDGGGKDRFRFDDKRGEGTWICNRCGAGNGVDLVMKFKGVEFIAALHEIERHLGQAKARPARAIVSSEEAVKRAETGWSYTTALDGRDPASSWLRNRGIVPKVWPPHLRWTGSAPYKHKDGSTTRHPAMVAKFSAPDGATYTLHRTYLDEAGYRADLAEIRTFAPGPLPDGGAVRLAGAAETMGVATGIETSLSAMKMFRIPVWATCNDRLMLKWKPPVQARRIVIFGDNDESYGGQMAAYGLAYALRQKGIDVAEVRIPDRAGWDWNDVDMEDQGIVPPGKQREPIHEDDACPKFEYSGDWL